MEILYSFEDKDGDGAAPQRAGVTIGADGALYRFTYAGGTLGHGTAYKLARLARPGGVWHETVLHSFGGLDGVRPQGAPVLGRDESLYGVAALGGRKDRRPLAAD